MADRFAPGDLVCTRTADPAGHSRLPRYARGATGTVVQVAGHHPPAGERARGRAAEPEAVYCVRFAAGELFGSGDHTVTVELWESYLDPAGAREEGVRPVSGDHASAPVAARVRHVEALLEARGLLDPGEIDGRIDAFLAGGTPLNGARITARAWVDAGFRERLLADANTAIGELGLSMGGGLQEQRLQVVANSADEHNVVVCTLCSCYPIALLGPSPSWYKSEAYRSRVVRDPRGVLREFGLELPETTRISVWDASAESRYLVLPRRPEGTEGRSEEELAALVTRNGLIGTAAL